MKILWLYASMPQYDHNHWYHMNFVKIIKQQNNVELLVYGYNLEKEYSDLATIHFNPNIKAIDLKKEFDFDIVIMDNRQRFFRNWDSSKFFNNTNNIPKIMIEGDFHLHKNEYLGDVWFKKSEINLILHRHYNNFILGQKILPEIKQIWFPCSVNTDIFQPNLNIERIPLIYPIHHKFAPKVYPYRELVTSILIQEKLVMCPKQKHLTGESYITCLQSYISHISDSSIYHVDVAKMFEIMASGSVLLTDEGDDYGLTRLFPSNSYCTYKRDGSNIIEKTKLIINDKDYSKNITENGIKCINQNHSHTIRARELINIIINYLKITNPLSVKLNIINNLCSAEEIQKIIKFKEYTSNNTELENKITVSELSIEDIFNKQISLDIKFWLLRESCLEAVIYKRLSKNYLYIGVKSPEIKQLINNKIQSNKLSITVELNRKTKVGNLNGNKIFVPIPVVKYLSDLYGNEIKKKLK